MTEEDWLGTSASMQELLSSCRGSPAERMLSFLRGRSSDRKFLLAACHAYRQLCAFHRGPVDLLAITICERHADRRTTPGELHRLIPVWLNRYDAQMPSRDDVNYSKARRIRGSLLELFDQVVSGGDIWTDTWAFTELELDVAPIIRDVFGNPFRPVAADPTWFTPTAVTLARRMYEPRDFSALPILADALQDAGCDHPDVLAHCRSDGPHARGCWVVDLVLGKS